MEPPHIGCYGFIDEVRISNVARAIAELPKAAPVRDANTICSKAQDGDAIREVVGLKTEIERIREQVQNVD